MVQPRLVDYIFIVVDPNYSDSIIVFVLGIVSNVNIMDYFKFYPLKHIISQNKSETFNRLIIPFLMKTLTNTEENKVQTSKRVIFRW